jgi:hypothetical protein
MEKAVPITAGIAASAALLAVVSIGAISGTSQLRASHNNSSVVDVYIGPARANGGAAPAAKIMQGVLAAKIMQGATPAAKIM